MPGVASPSGVGSTASPTPSAQIYNDGFSDGDLLGGVSHSLNGVERIEVLEGPGSALLGSGPPGGSIIRTTASTTSSNRSGASPPAASGTRC
ncbi:TonB-dependent receptor plug domain-containing protein [Burkholderia plantarii]|uniref:TonB-dependent receptor plug domain-containing protein n=1 Tax=Burkholderia plantarii TaxID=41899 RepID=UPI0008706C6F